MIPRRFAYLLIILAWLPATAMAALDLKILLTNDDGFEAPGIQALHEALVSAGHDVYLVAPATQQSGASMSITTSNRVTAYPGQIWAVEGTPADAVRFALGHIFIDTPPDLVVSGANFGQNTGADIPYSGTVGAAMTAYRAGIPSIAVSVAIREDEMTTGFGTTYAAFPGAARLISRLITKLDLNLLTHVLNVNYPAALPLDVRGIRWSELSDHSLISNRYYRRADGSYAAELQFPHPNSRKYDAESVNDGFVTMTLLDTVKAHSPSREQKRLSRDLLGNTELQQPEERKTLRELQRPDRTGTQADPSPSLKELQKAPQKREQPRVSKPEPAASATETISAPPPEAEPAPAVIDEQVDPVEEIDEELVEEIAAEAVIEESVEDTLTEQVRTDNQEVSDVEAIELPSTDNIEVNADAAPADPDISDEPLSVPEEPVQEQIVADPADTPVDLPRELQDDTIDAPAELRPEPPMTVETTSNPEEAVSEEAVSEETDAPSAQPVETEAIEAERNKPDSWLRRMFRPSSWRNK